MGKTINDLRESLFETMEAVKNGTLDIERAKTVAELGQTVINSAKVEVQYLVAAGGTASSDFIESNRAGELPPPPSGDGNPLQRMVTRSHRIGN